MPLLGQKSKFKVDPPKIRIEKVPIEKPKSSQSSKPKPKPIAGGAASKSSPRASPKPLSIRSDRASPLLSSSDEARAARKRKAGSAQPKRSPVGARVEFGKDSDEEDDGWEDAVDTEKRHKRGRLSDGRFVDLGRSLKHTKAFETPAGALDLIHAADVASLGLKCAPVLGAKEDEVNVELQYPSMHPPERYQLVRGKDMIDAVDSIIQVVRHVADTYLTDDQAKPFKDQGTGLIRKLEKASNRNVQDLQGFKSALREYNDTVSELVRNSTIARNLEKTHELPRHFVSFILEQVYDRTVAPNVELLSKYENGTDNVYGELLHPFVSEILTERLKMTSSQVFVDLGSGVGNVVLQAALEIGCESWGCEMMENACNLADAQVKEFAGRCPMWGLAPGKVTLERGDFRKNAAIHGALKRADVVLVNNQAFTSQLNDDLVRMFLDLKPGCKVVSLKNLVHDHKSASHNINDVGSTILDVELLTYPEGYVSWTSSGGTYCISTRK